jgi:hypothetical protein
MEKEKIVSVQMEEVKIVRVQMEEVKTVRVLEGKRRLSGSR